MCMYVCMCICICIPTRTVHMYIYIYIHTCNALSCLITYYIVLLSYNHNARRTTTHGLPTHIVASFVDTTPRDTRLYTICITIILYFRTETLTFLV